MVEMKQNPQSPDTPSILTPVLSGRVQDVSCLQFLLFPTAVFKVLRLIFISVSKISFRVTHM